MGRDPHALFDPEENEKELERLFFRDLTINILIDKARENHDINSDRKLAEFMGLKNSAVSYWRNGKSWPTDDNIVKLAELAEIDPEHVLIELAIWRSEGPAKAVWMEIEKRLLQAAAVLVGLIILTAPDAAHAASFAAGQIANKVTYALDTVYIMENMICYLYTMH